MVTDTELNVEQDAYKVDTNTKFKRRQNIINVILEELRNLHTARVPLPGQNLQVIQVVDVEDNIRALPGR